MVEVKWVSIFFGILLQALCAIKQPISVYNVRINPKTSPFSLESSKYKKHKEFINSIYHQISNSRPGEFKHPYLPKALSMVFGQNFKNTISNLGLSINQNETKESEGEKNIDNNQREISFFQSTQVSMGIFFPVDQSVRVASVLDTGSFETVIPYPKKYFQENQSLTPLEIQSYIQRSYEQGRNIIPCPIQFPEGYACSIAGYLSGAFMTVLLKEKLFMFSVPKDLEKFDSQIENENEYGNGNFNKKKRKAWIIRKKIEKAIKATEMEYIIHFIISPFNNNSRRGEESSSGSESKDMQNIGIVGVGGVGQKKRHRNKNSNNKGEGKVYSDFLYALNKEPTWIEFRLEAKEMIIQEALSDEIKKGNIDRKKLSDKNSFILDKFLTEVGTFRAGEEFQENEYLWSKISCGKNAFSSTKVFGLEVLGKKVLENHFFESTVGHVFDTGTSLMVLSDAYFWPLITTISEQLSLRKKNSKGEKDFRYELIEGRYFVLCFEKSFQLDFKILLKDFYIKVSVHDLVLFYNMVTPNDTACVLIHRLPPTYGYPINIMGYPIFKLLDTVFDYSESRIGFRKGKLCTGGCELSKYKDGFYYSEKWNYLAIIENIVLLSSVALGIILKMEEVKRKKRKDKITLNELLSEEIAV